MRINVTDKGTTLQDVKAFAAEQIKEGQRDLESFKKRFVDNPAAAFEWSHPAFRAAAKVHVGRTIESWINNFGDDVTVESIMDEVSRMVMQAVRFPENSTSQQSNTMKQEIAAVWGELLSKYAKWW